MLETIVKLSLISISVLPLVNSITMILSIFPLANVWLSIRAFPDTEALFDTMNPLTVVNFSIRPGEGALSMQFVIQVLAEVGRLIFEEFVAAPVTLIILPFALVYAAILINEDAKTLALALN